MLLVVACLVAVVVLLFLIFGGGGSPSAGRQLRKIDDCFRGLPHADANAVIRRCAKHGLR